MSAVAAPFAPRERAFANAEGAMTTAFRNLAGAAFVIPFLLALGATPFQIGLVGAAPFVGRVLQLGLFRWAQGRGARSTALLAGGAERLIILLLAGIPLLGLEGATVWLAVLLLCAFATFGEASSVATTAWFGARTPLVARGRFMARRTLWANGTATAVILAAGAFTYAFAGEQRVASVSVILLVGCVIGLFGIGMARRIHPLPEPVRVAAPTGIGSAVRDALADARFRSLLRYSLPWSAAVHLSSPFYTTYAVQELGYGILGTATLTAAGLAVGLLFLPLWGRLSDRYGNRVVLAGCGFWACMVPVLWIVLGTPEHPYAVFLAEAVGGMAWAGVNLATANLVLKTVPAEERVRGVAVFTALVGTVSGIAPVLGGMLVTTLMPLGAGVSFKALFAISATLRFAALWQLRRVPERGAQTLDRSVQVMTRCHFGLATPAGVGMVLLRVPLAASALRQRRTILVRRAGPAPALNRRAHADAKPVATSEARAA